MRGGEARETGGEEKARGEERRMMRTGGERGEGGGEGRGRGRREEGREVERTTKEEKRGRG